MAGALWLLRLTKDLSGPEEPVTYYGPIDVKWPVEWIGPERNTNDFPLFPELEWPDCARLRRVGRCCVGVRPVRPLPRGLGFKLPVDSNTGNSEPPGVPGQRFELLYPDAATAPLDIALYSGTAPSGAACDFNVASTVNYHRTASNPLAVVDADYILTTQSLFESTDNRFWQLYGGSVDYDGAQPLTQKEIPSLAIARKALPPVINKDREWWFLPEGTIDFGTPTDGLCGCDPHPPSRFIIRDVPSVSFDTFDGENCSGVCLAGSTPEGTFELPWRPDLYPFDQGWLVEFIGPTVRYRNTLIDVEWESNTWQAEIRCFGTNSWIGGFVVFGPPGAGGSQSAFFTNIGPPGDKCLEDWPRTLLIEWAGYIEADAVEVPFERII